MGGKGGDGGKGGHGVNGKPGAKGKNADNFSSGTDGEKGGNGGNGGDGTKGSDGGDGGYVQIIVAEDDMDLLYLLEPILVGGGEGGKAGANGIGGKGGAGGKGGDSYSWSDSYTTSHTDSDGNTHTSTEYTSYSNSGGRDGSPGVKGKDGNGSCMPGIKGKDGNYDYIVEYSQGPVRYSDKFDLQVKEFTMIFYEYDLVLEPGEKAYVSTMTLHNNGPMPSPIHNELVISVVENEWIYPLGDI